MPQNTPTVSPGSAVPSTARSACAILAVTLAALLSSSTALASPERGSGPDVPVEEPGDDPAARQEATSISNDESLGSPRHAIGVSVGWPSQVTYQTWHRSGLTLDVGAGLHLLFPGAHARAGYFLDTSQGRNFVRFSFVGGVRYADYTPLFGAGDTYVGPSTAVHMDWMRTGPRRKSGIALGVSVGTTLPISIYDGSVGTPESVPFAFEASHHVKVVF